MNPIGLETPKYKAGEPCKYHDPKRMMSYGAIFMGVFTDSAYIVTDQGIYTKIPREWLS